MVQGKTDLKKSIKILGVISNIVVFAAYIYKTVYYPVLCINMLLLHEYKYLLVIHQTI